MEKEYLEFGVYLSPNEKRALVAHLTASGELKRGLFRSQAQAMARERVAIKRHFRMILSDYLESMKG